MHHEQNIFAFDSSAINLILSLFPEIPKSIEFKGVEDAGVSYRTKNTEIRIWARMILATIEAG
jgi:hypothetical protein